METARRQRDLPGIRASADQNSTRWQTIGGTCLSCGNSIGTMMQMVGAFAEFRTRYAARKHVRPVWMPVRREGGFLTSYSNGTAGKKTLSKGENGVYTNYLTLPESRIS